MLYIVVFYPLCLSWVGKKVRLLLTFVWRTKNNCLFQGSTPGLTHTYETFMFVTDLEDNIMRCEVRNILWVRSGNPDYSQIPCCKNCWYCHKVCLRPNRDTRDTSIYAF